MKSSDVDVRMYVFFIILFGTSWGFGSFLGGLFSPCPSQVSMVVSGSPKRL